MWVAPLPGASTPLWQPTQLVVTPACDTLAPMGSRAPRPPRAAPDVATPGMTTPGSPAPTASRDATPALTTKPIVLRVVVVAVVTAATFLFAAPPFQLLGLWQLLQSWPTWWPFGRVVKLLTPKNFKLEASWHLSQVPPMKANMALCLAGFICGAAMMKDAKLTAWQDTHSVLPVGICTGDSTADLGVKFR